MSSRVRHIYMDYAAATPLSLRARDTMHAVDTVVGNPGSLHSHGQEAKQIYEDARARIARVLAVQKHDIIVTSGATEANNLAILGTLQDEIKKKNEERSKSGISRPHFITTAIEHSSVREVFTAPEVQNNADITLLPVDAHGQVRADVLRNALRPQTRFVSIGWANGEVGTIQPLRALVRVIREYAREHNIHIVVHTDAGQIGFAHSMQPQGVDVDMMTLGSGKLYGPRGAGVLYKRYDTPLAPIMYGGAQEWGLRPGTEDIVPAVGLAAALEELEKNRVDEYVRLQKLTHLFRELVRVALPQAVINGESKDQLPHITNISIPHIDSEYVMLALDHQGVSISTKSVCLEAAGEPVSHVIEAMTRAGAPENLFSKKSSGRSAQPDYFLEEFSGAANQNQTWRASTTLRFSFGRDTTEEDVRYTAATLVDIVTKHDIL